LSISQAVRELLPVQRLATMSDPATSIWNAKSLFDAALVLGHTIRRVYEKDGPALRAAGIDASSTLIFGGQIKGERMRLFLVYDTGNFIEATAETCYFQIGESKYGKPVLDRMIVPSTPLAAATKCALVSIDSTMKSNVSVGLPIDLLVYEANSLRCEELACIDETNPYFAMIREAWGQGLQSAFDALENPDWKSPSVPYPLRVRSKRYDVLQTIQNSGKAE
jgi:putative proteasome-type protease